MATNITNTTNNNKQLRTKIVYEPAGRAREYSPLAANLYRGCDHGCTYCYAPGALHMVREDFNHPTRRNQLLSALENDALLLAEAGETRPILLCFTCDPYQHLDEKLQCTRSAIKTLLKYGLNITILTKGGDRSMRDFDILSDHVEHCTYAATLTFTSEEDRLRYEPMAAPTTERINALQTAHEMGIKTWASLEPVIRPQQTLELIKQTSGFVDLYKVGTWNHDSEAQKIDWREFGNNAVSLLKQLGKNYYIKDDLKKWLK